MVRHPDPDGVAAPGGLGGHLRSPLDDHRQGTRPEGFGQGQRRRPDIVANPLEVGLVGHVHDQGMASGSPLGGEDLADGAGRAGIGAEAVHGLGREGHQLAPVEGGGGPIDVVGSEENGHGPGQGVVARAGPATPPPTTTSSR